jgi:hypothetical protein
MDMYGQSGDLSKDLRPNVSQAAGAVSEVNRVRQKGRKREVASDAAWSDALAESMGSAKAAESPALEERVCAVEEVIREEAAGPVSGETSSRGRGDAEALDSMMKEIRRMAEEPEKLLESHLGVFTEPAPPGKILNSRG